MAPRRSDSDWQRRYDASMEKQRKKKSEGSWWDLLDLPIGGLTGELFGPVVLVLAVPLLIYGGIQWLRSKVDT